MTESIVELYNRLETESKDRSRGKGEKSKLIRDEVEKVGKQLNKNELLISALFKTVKQLLTTKNPEFKMESAYFNQIMSNRWHTYKDKDGRLWVDLSKPVKKA